MLTLQTLAYIKGNNQTGGPIWNHATRILTSWKVANQDRTVQVKCGEVHTYASYKTARTWENFNNRGAKMFLLSDELWLIANNSKSFVMGISQ